MHLLSTWKQAFRLVPSKERHCVCLASALFGVIDPKLSMMSEDLVPSSRSGSSHQTWSCLACNCPLTCFFNFPSYLQLPEIPGFPRVLSHKLAAQRAQAQDCVNAGFQRMSLDGTQALDGEHKQPHIVSSSPAVSEYW